MLVSLAAWLHKISKNTKKIHRIDLRMVFSDHSAQSIRTRVYLVLLIIMCFWIAILTDKNQLPMPKFMDQENRLEGRWEFMAKAEWKDTFDFYYSRSYHYNLAQSGKKLISIKNSKTDFYIYILSLQSLESY